MKTVYIVRDEGCGCCPLPETYGVFDSKELAEIASKTMEEEYDIAIDEVVINTLIPIRPYKVPEVSLDSHARAFMPGLAAHIYRLDPSLRVVHLVDYDSTVIHLRVTKDNVAILTLDINKGDHVLGNLNTLVDKLKEMLNERRMR